jgi:hypothetical protein
MGGLERRDWCAQRRLTGGRRVDQGGILVAIVDRQTNKGNPVAFHDPFGFLAIVGRVGEVNDLDGRERWRDGFARSRSRFALARYQVVIWGAEME